MFSIFKRLTQVHPKAQIGENVIIGPYTVVEEDVVIGDNCWIGNHVTIMNGTRMGKGCKIFPGAVVGAIPQDLKYKGEYTTLEIGNEVTIREFCTLNRGTQEANRTVIGDRCLLMAYVHVAHDCFIGKSCILANNTTLAGHIHIDDFARLGGMTAVHQFVRIGKHVMISGGSLVRKDVPPYIIAAREPLSYAGVNRIGLRRSKVFSQETIHHIEDIYRILFVRGLSVRKAVAIIEQQIEPSAYRDEILNFIRDSKRGLMKGFRSINQMAILAENSADDASLTEKYTQE
ncbi:MAG: acyl-ACP--UDP-N-acetylglucosamine O-acyltransferase [Saprospiraceae bacterium]|nr:acyl-ACP--UDP-N-acetylglucosamine O-acyltransferase [Saprospiraceae bacterium]MDW8484845.1 acyl-ACP--UDP-N-acetylglucosamine O-acyltransferase [Saprospiraceae bacterium]